MHTSFEDKFRCGNGGTPERRGFGGAVLFSRATNFLVVVGRFSLRRTFRRQLRARSNPMGRFILLAIVAGCSTDRHSVDFAQLAPPTRGSIFPEFVYANHVQPEAPFRNAYQYRISSRRRPMRRSCVREATGIAAGKSRCSYALR